MIGGVDEMQRATLNELAKLFNALGHPVRLAIVVYLSKSRKGVVWEALRNALKEYGLPTDTNTLSFHLNVLVKSGVVIKVKVGNQLWVYKLNPEIKKWVKLSLVRDALLKNTLSPDNLGESDGEGAATSEVHIKRGGVTNT